MKIDVYVPSQYRELDLVEMTVWHAVPLSFGDEIVFEFCQALSRSILRDQTTVRRSELVALGFWLRRANLKKLLQHSSTGLYKALGTVLHFTPANVDTMFVYSWICALLAGNNNIIRVSSRRDEIQVYLLNLIDELFKDKRFEVISDRNLFLSYSPTKKDEIGSMLSLRADARVLWGGDESVKNIRKLPCSTRCRDISFADRFSACLIEASALSDTKVKKAAFELLVKDIKPYSQQACSSPKVMFWLGSVDSLYQFFHQQNGSVELDEGISNRNEQLVLSQSLQLLTDVNNVIEAHGILIVECQNITESLLSFHQGYNVLLCQCIDSLQDISEFCSNKKLQTLSYLSSNKAEILKFVENPSIRGIDRIVPLGKALDFSPDWDGFELFSQLARRVVVE